MANCNSNRSDDDSSFWHCLRSGASRSNYYFQPWLSPKMCDGYDVTRQGTSNMTWSEVMVKAGGPHPFGVWDFTIARIPILMVSIIYMVFIGYKLMPRHRQQPVP
ncbi:MAG: hypothetical protein V8S98_05230 [Lachnospiraceae bacterium]